MSWAWGRAAVGALAVATAACGAEPRRPPTEPAGRHPDGVAIDPLSPPPKAAEAAASTSFVVALRAPLGADQATATLREFFGAIAREDLEGVRLLLSPDASTIHTTTRAREPALAAWSRRFMRLDYLALSGASFWQEDGVELLRASEAESLWSDAAGPSATSTLPGAGAGDTLQPGDVVLRVPLALPGRSGAIFGSELVLLLRRAGGRFVIHRIVEDFSAPP